MENKIEQCLKEVNEVLARHKMALSPQVLIDSKGVQMAMQIIPALPKKQEVLK